MAGAVKKSGEKKTRTKAGLFTKLLLLAVILGLGWQLYRLRAQVEDAEAKQAQLAAEVDAQRQSNAALGERVGGGLSEEQMEEIARDELGLVSPGEKVFYDVSN